MSLSHTCEDYGERSTDHFPPVLFFFFFLNEEMTRAHHFHSFRSRISPQSSRLSEPLWTNNPCRAACEAFSIIGFHTIPGPRSQPTLTALGQG